MESLNRRSFLYGLVSFAALDAVRQQEICAATAPRDTAVVTLEDEQMRVVFDRRTGALLLMMNKQTGWHAQSDSGHSAAFRMHVPLPDRSDHFITEAENPLASLNVSPDGKSLEMSWAALRTPHAGALDISVHASLSLTESGLVSKSHIDNRSPYPIHSLSYPILADLRAPGDGVHLSSSNWGYGGMETAELLPEFQTAKGYWGADYPLLLANNWIPWNFVLIADEHEGLYVAVHAAELRDKVLFEFQLQPGYINSLDTSAVDAATGKPARIVLEVAQFFFAQPQSSKTGQAIVVCPYRGSWHAGADLYRKWRATWWRAPISPAWAEDVVSWQQIQINNAEDRLQFPYRDLSIYASDCVRYGVGAIQLTGWNAGGQDRNYPCHDTDPRLGTKEELRDAIDASRRMGVEVVLFNKYVYADISTDWWKTELHKYAAMDPFGMPYGMGSGYEYDTPTQLSHINARRLAIMCTACADWQRIARHEFLKSVDLHASGILFDEVCHHAAAFYCFSPDHGHAVPAYLYSADVPLAKQFREAVDPQNFLFAGEAPYDQELTCYRVYYTRILAHHTAIQRYIDSQLPIMIAVTGSNDRLMLNRALLHRYNVSYEPGDFKGRLTDFPLTMVYGGKIDALRRRYRRFLWDGAYRDTLDVTVTEDGKPHAPYSVFVDRNSGRKAVVLVNEEHGRSITLTIDMLRASRLEIATPDEPDARQASTKVLLPPESAAVLMEAETAP